MIMREHLIAARRPAISLSARSPEALTSAPSSSSSQEGEDEESEGEHVQSLQVKAKRLSVAYTSPFFFLPLLRVSNRAPSVFSLFSWGGRKSSCFKRRFYPLIPWNINAYARDFLLRTCLET